MGMFAVRPLCTAAKVRGSQFNVKREIVGSRRNRRLSVVMFFTRIDPGTATASFETELPDFKWKIAKKVANKADFPAIFLFRIGYPEYIRISA
jgi:hypothetical protein